MRRAKCGEDDPTVTQKIPTFAIFQDDEDQEEDVGEDDPTVTQQIPTFAIFQDGDQDEDQEEDLNDADQENATPPRSKSTRKNRPFRTLDDEDVRKCVLKPLPTLDDEEEEEEDASLPISGLNSPPVHRVEHLRTRGSGKIKIRICA